MVSQSWTIDPPARLALLEDFLSYPAALALLDLDGRVAATNDAFRERFGAFETDPVLRDLFCGRCAATGEFALDFELRSQRIRARGVRLKHHVLLAPESDKQIETKLAPGQLEPAAAALSAFDPATRAWNRAHFDQVIELELARSETTHSPLSVLLVDIDQAAALQAQLGGGVLNEVMRQLVQRLRVTLRGSDLVFRWGEQRYAIVVASAGYRRAEIVAEKLREAVQHSDFLPIGRLTLSIGVAEHDGAEATMNWFARLDALSRRALRAGGNRVVVDRRGASDRWAAQSAQGVLQLRWQEPYECGHELIDDQHRELFRLANNLIDASLQRGAGAAQVATPLDELIAHVQRHFADEEQVLAALNYADLVEHQRAHAALVRRAIQMKSMVEANTVPLESIIRFLTQDVVARHLLGVDAAFFPLLRTARRRG